MSIGSLSFMTRAGAGYLNPPRKSFEARMNIRVVQVHQKYTVKYNVRDVMISEYISRRPVLGRSSLCCPLIFRKRSTTELDHR